MNKKFTFREKLKYGFENTLSKGTIALIMWLGIISVLIVVVAAIIFVFTRFAQEGEQPMGFWEAFWESLMRTLDSGTMGGDTGWGFRIVMLCVTLGGIFIISALIGSLTSGLESKLEELRKGRSKVIETNHTLILGWSPKIMTVLTELIAANENQKNARIVILANKDKVEMDDEINDKIEDRKTTKIICRSGSPMDLNDLEIVNLHETKSVIVLTSDETGDIGVIKTVLAVTNNPNRRKEPYHIVAEIKDEKNLEAAYLVGGNEASFVYTADLIARITAQTCRQSGLSIIYTELLDFGGDEIYFKEEKSLVGKTYREALNAYEKCAVMGIMDNDENVLINPPMDTVLTEGNELIVIAEDDDKIILSQNQNFQVSKQFISNKPLAFSKKEKNLILGWNQKGAAIIRELDEYVKEGSEILIVQDIEEIDDCIKNVRKSVKNQNVEYLKKDITVRSTYDEFNLVDFNNIIILGYSSLEVQIADAKTLIALLHIRNICEKAGQHVSIVSEMFDLKNRKLAEVTKADDFIISENMISLMISQLSENKNLKKVFDELFKSDGSEIYLKPADEYINTGSTVDFYTILEAAALKNETAIGYKLNKYASDAEKSYGVFLNPLKTEKIEISDIDKIIVLAES